VAPDTKDDTLPLEDAVVMRKEAEEGRQEADKKLNEIIKALGLEL